MVCWVNSAPVMSVPYTTALEAIGYFLNSAFTAVDTFLTMDMLLVMSTWNCIKLCRVVTMVCYNQNRWVAVLCPLSTVKVQKLNTVFLIKLSRLSWAGHVFRLNESDPAKKVLLTGPGGQRPRGRPKLRWEEGIEEDAARAEIRNWKKTTANWEEWRNLLKEALAHPGL
jgi:hypothetical protein